MTSSALHCRACPVSITLCCWKLTPGAILKKFKECFGSSAPDLTNQLNFQIAVQGSGESPATLALPQLPHVHSHAIPRLCYRAEDKDAGMYTLDGQPKMVKEAVDWMQFFQHSSQGHHRNLSVMW